MGRLFGTDGIRGVANVDLTAPLAYRLGRATGELMGGRGRGVLVGQDTRRSSDMLVAAVSAGLASVGADAVQVGVVTTPCLAFLTAVADVAGVMVSASHNQAADNGLKVLRRGRKASDAVEEELERRMERTESVAGPGNDALGCIRFDSPGVGRYIDQLRTAAGDSLRGLRVAIDCANGSASVIAPELFRSLGADPIIHAAAPDGRNINLDCGSTHPAALQRLVIDSGADLGLAFDGDADRLIAVDERGALVDGDVIMGLCALERLAAGTLRNQTLVATVMSNGGLDRALGERGARVLRTAVGDRYVFEEMERSGAVLGGEQSGHIIFRDLAATGDGLLTGIELVKTLRRSGGAGLSELARQIPKLPQVVVNSAAREKDRWELDRELSTAVAAAQARLDGRGRVLVRPSGTEPKLRIMVEGEDEQEIAELAGELGALAEARLNHGPSSTARDAG